MHDDLHKSEKDSTLDVSSSLGLALRSDLRKGKRRTTTSKTPKTTQKEDANREQKADAKSLPEKKSYEKLHVKKSYLATESDAEVMIDFPK